MRKGKSFRIVAVIFMLLSLVSLSTYAVAGTAPLAVQDPPVPGEAQASGAGMPEIRDIGHSYDYVESYALPSLVAGRGDGTPPRAGLLSPSAIEGQPRELDWTPVRRVAVHPSNSQILYATISNGYGLYRSTSGGQFWRRLPIGVGSGWVIVFASDNTTALASFGDYSSGLGYYYNGGVYLSTDTGNTWTDVSSGIGYTVVAAAFDPGNVSRIYAATLGGGIYRTENGGGTWTPVNNGLVETWIFSIVASNSPGVLYAGGMEEVYYSSDYGANWTIADNTYSGDHVYNEALAVDPGNANTYYVGARRLSWWSPDGLTEGGFFKSTTGPGDGELVLKNSGMQDSFVLDIARDPLNSNILYAGTWGGGFYRSDNGGVTWVPKNAGLELQYIYGIEAVADGTSPSGVTLYVATFYTDHGVYTSTDRGDNWTDPWLATFPSMFDVTTSVNPDWVAAATANGVIISDDGGVNWYWSNGLTGGDRGIVLELARNPGTSSSLLAATYGGGIWNSADAGITWTEASAGIGGGSYVFDVMYSPNDTSTAYAGSYGVYKGTYSAGNWSWSALGSLGKWVRAVDAEGAGVPDVYAGTNDEGVHTSFDASGTWTATNAGLVDQRIRSLRAVGTSQLFAGTNGTSAWEYTFTTREGEEVADPEGSGIWTKVGPTITAPGVIQIAIHPNNDDVIFAGTDQGVYKSNNGGESWEAKNQGLGGYGDLVISGIAIDPNSPNTIYLGTWGYGVFKSTDGGDHWTRLTDPLKSSTNFLPLVLRNHTTSYEQVILYENFEGAFPGVWVVGDANPDDGLYYWGKRNCRPYSGAYSGWAAGAGSTTLPCGSYYRDNMTSWMIYGPFSLADASAAELTFKLWLNSESGYDALCRYASTDGSNFYGYCTTGNSGGWIDRILDLGGYTGQPNVWIALLFGSDGSITYPEGAHVDNIEVRKWVGTRAAPDLAAPENLPGTLRDEPSTFTLP